MEVSIEVEVENLESGARRQCCTAYSVFVILKSAEEAALVCLSSVSPMTTLRIDHDQDCVVCWLCVTAKAQAAKAATFGDHHPR